MMKNVTVERVSRRTAIQAVTATAFGAPMILGAQDKAGNIFVAEWVETGA